MYASYFSQRSGAFDSAKMEKCSLHLPQTFLSIHEWSPGCFEPSNCIHQGHTVAMHTAKLRILVAQIQSEVELT